jgi:hypothetical protein
MYSRLQRVSKVSIYLAPVAVSLLVLSGCGQVAEPLVEVAIQVGERVVSSAPLEAWSGRVIEAVEQKALTVVSEASHGGPIQALGRTTAGAASYAGEAAGATESVVAARLSRLRALLARAEASTAPTVAETELRAVATETLDLAEPQAMGSSSRILGKEVEDKIEKAISWLSDLQEADRENACQILRVYLLEHPEKLAEPGKLNTRILALIARKSLRTRGPVMFSSTLLEETIVKEEVNSAIAAEKSVAAIFSHPELSLKHKANLLANLVYVEGVRGPKLGGVLRTEKILANFRMTYPDITKAAEERLTQVYSGKLSPGALSAGGYRAKEKIARLGLDGCVPALTFIVEALYQIYEPEGLPENF